MLKLDGNASDVQVMLNEPTKYVEVIADFS